MKQKLLLFSLLLMLSFSSISAQDAMLGEIRMFAGNFAPYGWAKCEGQLLPIAQNSALFSLLGTTYGGDGETTFALPDFRGRIPIGPGNGPGLQPISLGEKSGTNTNSLTVANMANHNHAVIAASTDGNQSTPDGNLLGGTKLLDPEYSDSTSNLATMSSSMIGNTGGGQAVNNMQPSQSVTFIIALVGYFPSSN